MHPCLIDLFKDNQNTDCVRFCYTPHANGTRKTLEYTKNMSTPISHQYTPLLTAMWRADDPPAHASADLAIRVLRGHVAFSP